MTGRGRPAPRYMRKAIIWESFKRTCGCETNLAESNSSISVTFFIAYVVVLILVGVPLMSIEMGLGQFCSLPIASLFKALNATYVGKFPL